uniref:Uncharacterized protein n=1 Tax=Cannabis sativa TaxID=3483 RepID=A0A803PIL5_CANSA
MVKVIGKNVLVMTQDIHAFYSLPTFSREKQHLRIIEKDEEIDYVDVAETIVYPVLKFHEYDGEPYQLYCSYGVLEYSYDSKIPPQCKIDVRTVTRLKAPHPYGQPPPRQKQVPP